MCTLKILAQLFIFCFINLYSSYCISQINFNQGYNIPSTFPTSSKLIDLDNDGDVDLIRTFYGSSNSSSLNDSEIWINDGLGNYTLNQTIGGSVSFGFNAGDLDGDGDIDIFFARYNTGGLPHNEVWLNNGDATFTNTYQQLGSRDSSCVVLADFDDDGDLDALVGNSGNNSKENILWLNDGNGIFSEGSQFIGNDSTLNITSADIDNDNDIDVITANFGTTNRVWKNDGQGFFTNSQTFEETGIVSLDVSDIDGDNDIDLVMDNKVYKNNGNGIFSFHSNILASPLNTASSIKFSDFDGDGDQDMVVGIFDLQHNNRIFTNDGNGNFTEEFLFPISSYTDTVSIGDIDNDGDMDVFFLNTNNQNSRFWKNETVLNIYDNQNFKPILYPNPFNEYFKIDLHYYVKKVNVKIRTIKGELVFSEKYDNEKSLTINTKLSNGFYILELTIDNNRRKIFKIIRN